MFTNQYQPYQDLKETGEHDDVLQTEGNVLETFSHKNTKSRKGQAHKIKKSSHKSKPRQPNAYIIFYRDFYKKILEKEFPHISQQDKIKKTGEAWRDLPNELKNEFYQYAHKDKFLMTQSPDSPSIPLVSNLKEDTLKFIFDSRCLNNIAEAEMDTAKPPSYASVEVIEDIEDIEYEKLFEQLINTELLGEENEPEALI